MYKTGWILGILTLMGLGIRLWGFDFGLPNESRPDELPLVEAALKSVLTPLVTQGDWRLYPNFWMYPAGFIHLLSGSYGVYYFVGHLFGWFPDWQAFLTSYGMDSTPFFLIARGWSVLGGTLCVPALYQLGFRWRQGEKDQQVVALTAALLMAFCYLAVRNSHFGTVDTLLTLGGIIALTWIMEFTQSRQSKFMVGAAIAIGGTTAIKYPGVLLGVPFGMSLLHVYLIQPVKQWKAFFGKVLGGGGLIFLTLFILSPWLFLEFSQLINYLSLMSHFQYNPTGSVLPATDSGWLFYPGFALLHGLGFLLLVVSLLGMGWSWAKERPDRRHWILWSYLLVGTLTLGGNVHAATRFILPMVPVLLLYAALGSTQLSDWITQTFYRLGATRLSPQVVLTSLLGVVLYHSLTTSAIFSWLLTQPDTRTLARNWIVGHIPPGQTLATGPSSGRIILPPSYHQLLLQWGPPPPVLPQDLSIQPMDSQNDTIAAYGNLEALRKQGIHYVCLYQGHPVAENARWELEIFLKQATLLEHWSPYDLPLSKIHWDPIDAFFLPYHHFQGFVRPGPEIYLFKI